MAEIIYEAIVISCDAQGQPHIAPFGVRLRGDRVLIAPFRPSASLDNLLSQKSATLNFTDDVRVYAGALTGKRTWPVRSAQHIAGYVLESALSHQELVLDEVVEDDLRPQLLFKVVHEEHHKPFKGYNRAQAAVIELAVLVSRLHMLPADKVHAEMAYLQTAIEKTAGERELEAWGWLVERVENYYAEIAGANLA